VGSSIGFFGLCLLFSFLCGGSSSGSQTKNGLEGIVDPPLKTSESTDHENTSTETLCKKILHADFACDLSDGFSFVAGFSELGHEGVGGVRNDGANDTSDVTRSKCDLQLGGLRVLILGLREDVGVESLDDLLEEIELGHGVWDLARPQWGQAAEWKSSFGAIGRHGGHSCGQGGGERAHRRRLDLDLHHLHGAERNISEEFGRGRGAQPDKTLVASKKTLHRPCWRTDP